MLLKAVTAARIFTPVKHYDASTFSHRYAAKPSTAGTGAVEYNDWAAQR